MPSRVAATAVTALMAAGCAGGSSPPTLERFVPAPHVGAELALAHAGTGFRLVGEDGRSRGVLGLPRTLTSGASPAWSPVGTSIAFTAATDARARGVLLPPTDVYVMGIADGTARRVTAARNALYPEWSPDGRWVEYSAVTKAGHGRTAAIWIVHPDGMNPDASRQRRLAAESEQPAWSPDGRHIVFASARDHVARIRIGEDEDSWIRQIYVMDADGSSQRRLITTASDDRWPDWAPGGAVIAYETTSRQTSLTTAVVVNADGTCRHTVSPRLTGRFDVGYHTPAWRPGGVGAGLAC